MCRTINKKNLCPGPVKTGWLLFTCFLIQGMAATGQNLNNPNKKGPLGTQVNTLSGNVFIPRTDMYIPARGFNLNLSFYYNSFLFAEDNGYGRGWTFEYHIRYRTAGTLPGARLILWGDGREDQYDSIPGGYRSPRGFFSKLKQYQPGKYVLIETDSVQYFFDNAVHKRITRVQEPNGNAINFNYTDTLLTSITNTAGQTISLTYNSNGRLVAVTDAMAMPSRTCTYTYDVAGNLTEVKDPLNGKSKYSYLVNGPMKAITDKNSNKADIIYYPDMAAREIIGCNKRISFSYDTLTQRTVVTDHLSAGNQVTAYTYQKLDNLSWITGIKGNCCGFNMNYVYDDQGNMLQMTDANGQVYSYTYDGFGNVLTLTGPLNQKAFYTYTADYKKLSSHKDPQGNLYTLSYDSHGNLVQLATPGNNIYTAVYNAQGNIISSTGPRGNTFTYNYDAYGNPATVTGPNGYSASLMYDARGNLLSHTDARGNTSAAEYDILNRLKKITDPYNNNIQISYDAVGNMVTYTGKNNETSTFSYDAGNRLVKLTGPANKQAGFTWDGMDNLTGIIRPLGNKTEYSYDTRNRLKQVNDAEGNKTAYTYDGNGNITSAVMPNGQTLNYSYDALNRLVSVSDATSTIAALAYDKNGNITSYTNAEGAVITAVYDSLNRVKQVTDPLGYHTLYAYDRNNNVTAVTDREGRTATRSYDSLNRVKTFTDNNNHTITIGYDAMNNVVQLTDQNNNTTTYTYDSLNRRKRMVFPDNTWQEFSYDKKNNITGRRLTDGSVITYQYDSLNRMVMKTLPGGEIFSYAYDELGRVTAATNAAGTVNFTYDVLNRITSETFDSRTIRYTYNISGRTQTTIYPDSAIVIKEFDTRNRLIKILKDGKTVAAYSYNNANQLLNKTTGNGIVTNYQYDFANRLSSITTSNNIQNSSFAYDKERNKTAITRNNNPSLSEQFTCDNGYRLTGYKRGPAGNTVVQNTYTYDAVGNRTAANLNGAAKTYGINNLNQLTAVNGTNHIFDNRGNLVFDGLWHKTYDAENRLQKDSAITGNTITYHYDALNRRVKKTTNGGTVKYTYSGAAQIEERNSSNLLLNRTVFSNFLSPVMNEQNGNQFYLHNNEQLSVEAISNNSGRLIESYRYDVYGKLSRYDSLNNPLATSLAGNRFGFTGQEYDSATGSYRFFYRNYSPETGVFNQRDLIEYTDGMGMYQYVGNNPANGLDLWGLESRGSKCMMHATDEELRDYFKERNEKERFWNDVIDWSDKSADSKNLLELGLFALDIKLPGPVDFITSPVGIPSSVNKISNSIGEFGSPGNSATENYLHAADAVKNGAGVSLDVVAIGGVASLMPAGVASAAVAKLANLGLWTIDKGSQLTFNGLAEQGARIYAIDSEWELEFNYLNSAKNETEMKEREDKWSKYKRSIEKLHNLNYEIRTLSNQTPDNCLSAGGTRIQFRLVWDKNEKMWVLRPVDPNLIVGPDGEPGKAWVSIKDRLPYTIMFENDSSATAPAKYVRITTPIEPKQEAGTFELGNFGFNNQSFEIPAAQASYYKRLDCRDSMNLFVDVTAGYDPVRNEAFWEFQSIDPVTLLPSEEPLAGFLFLNNPAAPNYGKGFVNFSIKPRTTAQTRDTIGARAFIVFDQNDTIPTNIHTNTIDALAPTSAMANLPDITPDTEVRLTYTGTDDPNGSGVKWYAVYVSDNNAPPELYLNNITVTDTVFHGQAEHTYKFYITATDTAGNVEPLRLVDSIKITNGQTIICPGANVSFDSRLTGASFQWQADTGTGYTNIINGGIYSGANSAVLGIAAPPTNMYGHRFRCLVNGTVYSLEFILKFAMSWEGSVSNIWENPANWSCNTLPDAFTDVVINGGRPNYPQVNSHTTIRTLRMNPGATGTVTTGFTLTVIK